MCVYAVELGSLVNTFLPQLSRLDLVFCPDPFRKNREESEHDTKLACTVAVQESDESSGKGLEADCISSLACAIVYGLYTYN